MKEDDRRTGSEDPSQRGAISLVVLYRYGVTRQGKDQQGVDKDESEEEDSQLGPLEPEERFNQRMLQYRQLFHARGCCNKGRNYSHLQLPFRRQHVEVNDDLWTDCSERVRLFAQVG